MLDEWPAVFTAQAGPGDLPNWLIPVASALGGVLVTALSGKLVVPTFAYLRERERADKWETETMRLNEVIADRVVPALGISARANEESTEALKLAIAAFGRS